MWLLYNMNKLLISEKPLKAVGGFLVNVNTPTQQ